MMPIDLPSDTEIAAAVARWRAADPRFAQLLTRYGATAPAARHYGLILWQAGVLTTADAALRCAVAAAPEAADAWIDLAGVREAAGAPREAAACLEAALARNDRQSQGWLRLAMLRGSLGETDGVEAAYRRALALDPSSTPALFGLGLFHFNARRFADAVAPLRDCIARDPAANPAAFACLGQALYYVGDFPGAATAFAEAKRLYPDNRVIWLKWLRARFAADVIDGDVEAAIDACRGHAELTAAEFEQTLREGFHVLSGYGQRAAAIRLGAARLARKPDDPVQAYLLAALKGEPLSRAPDDYVVAYFDHFAAGFDQQLVDVLDYRAPDILTAMIARHPRPLPRILDLGCGTGLAGPLLAGDGRRLTGLDLSPRMLDAARARGCYAELVEAEALTFLRAHQRSFDLVFAADVLVYLGDPTAFFVETARALTPGGLLAISLETTEADVALQPSGRFAHSVASATRLAAAVSLALLETGHGAIRLEAGVPLAGAYMLFERV
jgi:predicted TPR repeat methyltransferase